MKKMGNIKKKKEKNELTKEKEKKKKIERKEFTYSAKKHKRYSVFRRQRLRTGDRDKEVVKMN